MNSPAKPKPTAVDVIVAWGCLVASVLLVLAAMAGLIFIVWVLLNIAPTAA